MLVSSFGMEILSFSIRDCFLGSPQEQKTCTTKRRLKICLLIADVQIALRTTVVLKQVLAAKSVNFQYQIQQKPQLKYVNLQSTTLAVISMAGLAKSLKHRCCSTFVSR